MNRRSFLSMLGLGAAAAAAGGPLALLPQPIRPDLFNFRMRMCREYVKESLFTPHGILYNGVLIREVPDLTEWTDEET